MHFRIRMMSFCLFGGASVSFSIASTILPLSADRSVGVSVNLVDGEINSFDEDSVSSDTLDPFNAAVAANALIAPATGSGIATHSSDVTPLSIIGSADLSGLIEIPAGDTLTGADISGGANLLVSFSVSEPTAFTLVASANVSSPIPNSVQGVSLTGPGGTIVSAEGFDTFIANVNTAGVLVAGDYELHVYFIMTSDAADLNGPATNTAAGHFDVNFQVPEPASLLAFGLLGALALRRR